MDVVSTEWALQSYLDLVHSAIFSRQEYWSVIRPDVERLKAYPTPQEFRNPGFWGPVTDKAGKVVGDGFKMKWRNLGPGRIQLRLCVAIFGGRSYLCRGWVKNSPAADKREAATLKRHINIISAGHHTERGLI